MLRIVFVLLGMIVGSGVSSHVSAFYGDNVNDKTIIDEPVVLVSGLSDARSIRLSTSGNLFLVDSGNHRLLKITKEGLRADSVGRLGSGDYQFDNPVAIDPSNELKIYVADRNNRRIQVFDRRMQYLSTIQLPRRSGIGTSYRPTLLAVDRTGRVYFFDEERHLVYRYDSNGQFDLGFELFSQEERIMPVSMDIYDEVLWVADRRGEMLHRFSSAGSYLGFIYAPEPVTSLRMVQNQLWVLGTLNIQQIDRSGRVEKRLTLPQRGDLSGRWRSFDIGSDHAFLLDETKLIRLPFEGPKELETDP